MGNVWTIGIGLAFVALGIGAILGINLWRYFWPTMLILLGLNFLFHQANPPLVYQQSHESTLDTATVFSGTDKKIVTEKFEGGKVSAVFGGTTLDLRSAKIEKNKTVMLEVSAVFGGIKVIVPKTWIVQGSLAGVFGGFDNRTTVPDKPDGTLILKGATVFGGGEIVN